MLNQLFFDCDKFNDIDNQFVKINALSNSVEIQTEINNADNKIGIILEENEFAVDSENSKVKVNYNISKNNECSDHNFNVFITNSWRPVNFE